MNPAVATKRRNQATQARKENGSDSGPQDNGRHHINVGEGERQLSMISGSILALCGLLRGSISGMALAALGGALIYRGHTGHCTVYEAMGHNSAQAGSCKRIQRSEPSPPERDTSAQPS